MEVEYRYREYRDEPLSEAELRDVFAKLGAAPRELLRAREAKSLEIGDDASDDELIAAMAKHPTLVQRPIAIDGDRAILARPADLLRDFIVE